MNEEIHFKSFVLQEEEARVLNKKDDKKIHIYHITLTNGELLKNTRVEGSLEWRLSGIAANLIAVEDDNGKKIVLSKYQIVKAELENIED
ncbi:hypothetical protein [Bacillus sp. EAC]|uniref:hypothetical protein n=1 Tax=Bacillus sp. EAC TaxID=1978338 RepID=UPI00211AACAA|nr:hypothetical protein [Bacillus sp. EAC]